MRRAVATAAVMVLVSGLTFEISTLGADASTPSRPTRAEALSRAGKAVAAHPGAVQAAAADAYAVDRVVLDATGASHVRYTRTYAGLPVIGGDFVVHNTASGTYAGISTAQPAEIDVSTTPAVTAAAAAKASRKAFSGTVATVGTPALRVDAYEPGGRLEYETVVTGFQADGQTPSKLHVFTDATTGAVVGTDDEVETVAGTGKSIYSGTVTVDTTLSGSTYSMKDPSHGNGYACDMQNKTSGTCTTFTDADNVWGSGTTSDRASAGVDAYFGAAATFDYYKTTFGRNGIFGDGAGVPSRVHYGSSYVNAFWDGTQMTYGDGAGNADPLVSLDVAAHEMSHGVSESLVDLTYSGESGGINEANSDIFGTMVEFYANTTSDPGDYLIGEEIDINGDGTPLRYMYNPSLDGGSVSCWSSSTAGLDVHYSSGVGNHFFFLLAEGSGATAYGTSPVCSGAAAVTGVGKAKAAAIWYRALDVYFTSSTKYKDTSTSNNDARNYTLKAATDLYGQCSTEYKAVQSAWTAVNVAGEDASCSSSTSTATATSTSTATATSTTCATVTSTTAVAIPDAGAAVSSPLTVSGCTGTASATTKVAVTITHTFRGDLVISLVAPDGTSYALKSSSASDGTDNVNATYTVNASSETKNGTWTLKVQDVYSTDTGTLTGWSLTL